MLHSLPPRPRVPHLAALRVTLARCRPSRAAGCSDCPSARVCPESKTSPDVAFRVVARATTCPDRAPAHQCRRWCSARSRPSNASCRRRRQPLSRHYPTALGDSTKISRPPYPRSGQRERRAGNRGREHRILNDGSRNEENGCNIRMRHLEQPRVVDLPRGSSNCARADVTFADAWQNVATYQPDSTGPGRT